MQSCSNGLDMHVSIQHANRLALFDFIQSQHSGTDDSVVQTLFLSSNIYGLSIQ